MKSKPSSGARGRRDHYVPQGYLRGFIHSQRQDHPKPLWVLNVQRHEWSEKSPSQIGWERGFYDYARGSNPDATAEDAFRRLENDVPRIREHIRTNGYQSWTEHREILVDFAVMIATRSPFFRRQAISHVRSLADGYTGDVLAKNYAITLMRTEMRRRSQEWKEYDWVLGYTKDPEHPFIASDQVVGMKGNAPKPLDALQRNDFWLWCPLSWDMCLVASSRPLDAEPTAPLQPGAFDRTPDADEATGGEVCGVASADFTSHSQLNDSCSLRSPTRCPTPRSRPRTSAYDIEPAWPSP